MGEPFNRFAKLEQHTQQIIGAVTDSIRQSYVEGAKDGVDLAAKVCDELARQLRASPLPVGPAECVQIATAEFLRDQVRLVAHQIPDPDPTPTVPREDE